MADNWEELSLREAGVQLLDCDHKTPVAVADGYPYITIPQLKNGRIDPTDARRITEEDFRTWTRKTNPQAWDVVVSRRCNPGETAVVPPSFEFALGQNLIILRSVGQRIFPQYLRWLLGSPSWWEQVQTFNNVGADGRQVLTVDMRQTLRLWDVATGKELRTFEGYADSATGLIFYSPRIAFSPDGKYVLTGGARNTARLWDVATGKEIRKFEGVAGPVRSVAFSPDGKQALLAGTSGTASLWDISDIGQQILLLKGHSGSINAVAFSSDTTQVMTGSVSDGTVRLWDVTTGTATQTFREADVLSVAFSPDGKQVLTGSSSGRLRRWDGASGTEMPIAQGPAISNAVAISPDAKQVLSTLGSSQSSWLAMS